MNDGIRPSVVLDMTLPMFELLKIDGTDNFETITKIVKNLRSLHSALLRIEKEVNSGDGYNQQGKDI